MTQSEIELVQASFAKVVPISQQAATLFYDRLFSLNPSRPDSAFRYRDGS